ncbi:MAG: polysaccharide biosynthesis/export family protein [Magnetococcales bacterium]|nr:polysaccharide biosynthesis/export family protein [Magnetococcales bacterium]
MNKKLVAIRLLLLLAPWLAVGCTSQVRPDFPEGKDLVELDLPPDHPGVPKHFKTYPLAPGDELDVLFQIRTWDTNQSYLFTLDDVVTIKFVHAPELNETQRVRPDGSISLPYVGQVKVAGLTVEELAKQLRESYAKVLRDPELFVIPSEIRNQIKELKNDLKTASRGLSRLVTIRPDGFVTFPLVGDVFVAGRTIPEVEDELNLKYDKFLKGLNVDLFLQQQAGSMVYVMGEVTKPGSYPLRKPSTVMEALALAGSYTPDAKLDSIVLMRAKDRKITAQRIDLQELTGLQSGLALLQPDDIILVPRTRVSHLAQVVRQFADVFLFNGIGIGSNWPISNGPMIGPR